MAVREVAYVLSTLLALWVNPAYLLMELGSVWKEEEPAEAAGGGCCGRCGRWMRSVDPEALTQRVLYFLAPHHYVTACLVRWAKSTPRVGGGEEGALQTLFVVIGMLQFMADVVSADAIFMLLAQPEPPSALAIGYWLTAAGLVAGAGLGALVMPGAAWTGRDPEDGSRMGWCVRAIFGIAGLLGGAIFLFGAYLLALAPLQLGGAVRGFAPA